jgi:signal transduction histidine kinase
MPDGGDVRIKTGSSGNYIYVSVADQGEGISPENLDNIFEPFFTTKKKGEGTGLGLSLSKRLVEASNGKIEVESAAGQGSIFKILLPIKQIRI